MTDTKLLKDKIKSSGLKLGYIAEKCGLTRQGLYKKIIGKNQFTQNEIKILSDVLSIEPVVEMQSIFFASDVDL